MTANLDITGQPVLAIATFADAWSIVGDLAASGSGCGRSHHCDPRNGDRVLVAWRSSDGDMPNRRWEVGLKYEAAKAMPLMLVRLNRAVAEPAASSITPCSLTATVWSPYWEQRAVLDLEANDSFAR